jgi:polar amino acid transport system substrate-binding protein
MYRPPEWSRFAAVNGRTYDFDDLNSTRIGVLDKTIQYSYLRNNLDERANQITSYRTFGGMLRDLGSGALHLVLADEESLVEAMASDPRLEFKGDPVPLGPGIGIGLRKEDDELRQRLNTALASMKADGSLDALLTRWFEGKSPLFGEGN